MGPDLFAPTQQNIASDVLYFNREPNPLVYFLHEVNKDSIL